MATILGIDEAGRGSVIGPLYVAGVMIDEKDNAKLIRLGVKDSKMLTPQKREELYPIIKEIALDHAILKVSAQDIDNFRKTRNLNVIEAEKMAQIIKALKADKAYVDAPQVSTEKFKAFLMNLAKNHTEIIAENKADEKYPVCSAASILAKVNRDRDVEEIKRITGFDIGVGYSHDSRSIAFVKKFLNHREYSKFIRHSWMTVEDIKSEKEQKSLSQY